MNALAPLVLAAALQAPSSVPPAALAPVQEAPALDWGRTSFAAAVGMPTHLAATAAVLVFACSGEVIRASCGSSIEGAGGARAATYLLLATLPPLASGATVWAIGDDDRAPASLPWTLAGGAAGQLLGVGLAFAADSPALAVLSLTVFPVAGELAGLLGTRAPLPAAAPAPALHGAEGTWLVPLASGSF
jgi:hypothetical protein